jgi:hypothetical protein
LRNGLGAAEVLLIRQYFIDKQTAVTTHVLPVGYALADTEVLILPVFKGLRQIEQLFKFF